MKPVGNLLIDVHGSLTDEDAESIKEMLGLDDPTKLITPIHLTDSLIDDALTGVKKDLDERLLEAYSIISNSRISGKSITSCEIFISASMIELISAGVSPLTPAIKG